MIIPQQVEDDQYSLQNIIENEEIEIEQFRPAEENLINEVEHDRNQHQELQIEESNSRSPSRRSKRLASQRSRGINILDGDSDDYHHLREMNFS